VSTLIRLKVNQAARALGVSEAWLRRAERSGRIPVARRDANGWRYYTPGDMDRIQKAFLPPGAHKDSDDATQRSTTG